MSSYAERTIAAFERLETENAKLRELASRMRDHIKSSCVECDELYCSSWDEDNGCCVYDTCP